MSFHTEDFDQLTSWENFTRVLRGLVEELIQLGAKSKLRRVTFQLWASYLQRKQIAFFSYSENEMPVLPLKFKTADAKILLYKFQNVQNNGARKYHSVSRKKRHLSSSSDSNYEQCSQFEKEVSLSKGKRSVVKKSSAAIMNGNSEKEMKIPVEESTCETIVEQTQECTEHNKSQDENVSSNEQNYFDGETSIGFTFNTLLAILRLALLLIEDDIQLTDLLRWICEGRLSVNHLIKFMSENSSIRRTDLIFAARNNFMKTDLVQMSQILKITLIPTPNLFKLTERYCEELALPNELSQFTQKLMYLFLPHMDYMEYDYRIFPDYECRAMAFVVFAVKLLFSLDDCTEAEQSKFADAINNCARVTSFENVPVLFSWSSWVKYIECRKAVLSKYDVSSNELWDASEEMVDENVFLDFWQSTKQYSINNIKNTEFKESTLNELKTTSEACQMKFFNEKSGAVDIEFPPTLTPFKTYTEYILINHPEILSGKCRQILSNNFTSSSIEHILDHTWALSIGEKFHLEVKIVLDAAEKEKNKYEAPTSNVVTISNTIPGHIPIDVIIDDANEEIIEKELYKMKKFYPEFTYLNSEIDESKNSKIFKLYQPWVNFWSFQDINRSMKYENFNTLAVEHFPNSFLWFLKECSRVVRCNLYDLFVELVTVERVYHYLFAEGDPDEDLGGLHIYSNEW